MEPIASGSGPGNTAPVEDCWDRVNLLLSEVSRIDETMHHLIQLLEQSPLMNLQSNQTTDIPAQNTDAPPQAPKPVHLHDVPPHIQPTLALRYQPPTTQEFSHLSRLEPLKLLDVWFSGNASNLTLFLRTIRNFLRP